MKFNLLFITSVFCVLSITAFCQQPTGSSTDLKQIKKEIQDAENAWDEALNAKDLDALMAMYTDDANSMANNAPMLAGKDAIRAAQEKEFSTMPEGLTYSFETLDVYGNGDIVTETGKSTYKDASGKVVGTGKYMVVWKKQGDKYLCFREIYNNDTPPAPSNVRRFHLFDLPDGLTEAEWLGVINDMNSVIAELGYHGAGYYLYKSQDDQVKDYRYFFEGVWPSEEVYQVIRNAPALKAAYQKTQSQYAKIKEVEIFRQMHRMQ